MNLSRILFIVGAALLLVIAAVVLSHLFAVGFIFVVAALPILFTICGAVSCLQSSKPPNTRLLWLIVIILAPFLGPLLWFVWGRQNT
jgi:hypothetical protein